MSRYFTRSRASFVGDAEPPYHGLMPDLSVSDHRPVDTGLLDVRGEAIFRAPRPVGFGRMEEW